MPERATLKRRGKAALKRVRQNKGSPGVDGMTVDELPKHLVENWEAIRAQLLDGNYQPKPGPGKLRTGMVAEA
jgi:retron-type reverse transcriptase